jgi:hypothetical protein
MLDGGIHYTTCPTFGVHYRYILRYTKSVIAKSLVLVLLEREK